VDDSAIERAQREYEALLPNHAAFTDALRTLVGQLCRRHPDLEIDSIHSRTKTAPSVVEKLRRREYTSLDDVVDKCGIRIIAADQSLVGPTCELLTGELEVIEDVEHGTEAANTFGYTSRHLVVRIKPPRSELPEWQQFAGLVAEIQVRSVLQHAWALISHRLAYKSSAEMPERVQRQLSRMAAFLEETDERFADFRTEVREVRAEIREEVERESWEKVKLDLFSLEEAWDRFPWREIHATAVKAGFLDASSWTYELPLDEHDRHVLSRLVRVAAAAGVANLGQLSEEAHAATSDAALRRICEEARNEGEIPYAIAPDVLVMLLIHDHADEEDVADAARGEDGLVASFVDAAVKAGRHRPDRPA
jgi:putative GTP pyrophosphokinase